MGTRGGVFLTGGNFSGCGVFTWLTSRAVRVVYEKFIVVRGIQKLPLIASRDASPLRCAARSNAEPEKSVLLCVFPLSTLLPMVEMDPFSSQLRAFITSPGVDLEASSGSPEDYDDRNGYLPDFLGGASR